MNFVFLYVYDALMFKKCTNRRKSIRIEEREQGGGGGKLKEEI